MPANLSCRCALPPALAAGLLFSLLFMVIAACAPTRMPSGPAPTEPQLTDDSFIMADGMTLPLRSWLPDSDRWPTPKAMILALHGFNDYSNAFEGPGQWWAERGIATFAYDQRGFGAGLHTGLWAGSDVLADDARTAARLLAARHPKVPLYVLGESMGGAVAIVAWSQPDPPLVDGVILAAPAVWSRDSMPLHQRVALWLAARTMPWAQFTGEGLGIQASDNTEMLRALGRDPLFIKETRVDAMDGLTDLMSEALAAAPHFAAPALLLYGEKDEVVPRAPSLRFWRNLPAAAQARQRKALYDEGWHMLLRDLQAEVVLEDIADWIGSANAPLPSGADRRAEAALAGDEGERALASDDMTPGDTEPSGPAPL